MINLIVSETIGAESNTDLDELENQVKSRLHGKVRHFRLMLREGGLVLTGHSPSFYGKQLAQHAVMTTTRLRILANNIQVH